MQIIPTGTPGTSPGSSPGSSPGTSLEVRAAAVARWTVGQLLSAEVIGTPRGNYTQLRIADAVVTARSDVPFRPGQQLALQVAGAGRTVLLKVLDPAQAASALRTLATGDVAGAAVTRTLARILPLQATLPETTQLLRVVDALARDAGRPSPPRLPAALAAPAAERASLLMRSLPRAQDMQEPARLRASIENGARPLEAKLAPVTVGTTATAAESDLRWQLLHLGQALTPRSPNSPQPMPPTPATATNIAPQDPVRAAPDAAARPDPAAPLRDAGAELDVPRLRALIEGAVARVTATHVQNLPTHSGAPAGLVLELPLAHADGVDVLQFEYEAHGDAQDPEGDVPGGSVIVNLVMDGPHDLCARIGLKGDTLSVQVGSTHDGMNAVIATRLDELRHGIEQHGHAVGRITTGATPPDGKPKIGGRRLVDESV